MPSLRSLSLLFGRYCTLTFGGGNPTVFVLQQELVEKRRWLDPLQFGLSYAISRVTPGTNLLAFCTAAGFIIRGWTGALAVLLATSLPCAIIATLVTHLYESWVKHPTIALAIRGALAATVGIMFAGCWQLARPFFEARSWLTPLLLVAGSFVLAFYFSVPPLRIILLAAVVGWLRPVGPAA